MIEILPLIFAGGICLGFLYFRCLWMTVKRLPESRHPIRLMAISFLFRMTLALLAFYLLMDGHAGRLFAALAGFIAAREIYKRFLGAKSERKNLPIAANDG